MIHTPGETLKDLHEQLAKGDGQFQGVDVKGFNDHQKGVVRNMTEKYINNLVTNLDKRFPEAMDIVNCMNTVLNPNCLPESAKGIINHGERELGVLMKHFGTETTVKLNHATIVKMKMIDGERLKRDFLQFKYLLNVHRVQTDIDLTRKAPRVGANSSSVLILHLICIISNKYQNSGIFSKTKRKPEKVAKHT